MKLYYRAVKRGIKSGAVGFRNYLAASRLPRWDPVANAKRMADEAMRYAPSPGGLYLQSPTELYDGPYFDQGQFQGEAAIAPLLVDVLMDAFSPTSVVEFGCAWAFNLRPFHERGIRVHGFEGSQHAIDRSVIPRELVTHADLRLPINAASPPFDLAICFEVLEHLDREFAGILVWNIVNSAKHVVITAAPPQSSGHNDSPHHHPNEQRPEYWEDLFAFFGCRVDRTRADLLQEALTKIPGSDFHLRSVQVFQTPLRMAL